MLRVCLQRVDHIRWAADRCCERSPIHLISFHISHGTCFRAGENRDGCLDTCTIFAGDFERDHVDIFLADGVPVAGSLTSH